MSALPSRLGSDEPQVADSGAVDPPARIDLTLPPEIVAPRARPRELTVRALVVGLAIGAVLAAGNVYTGLKSSYIDGGALTAALLSFMFFTTFKRLARVPFGPFENNIAQTAAASAALMPFVHGLGGPMPALMLMGKAPPPWAVWLWGLALGLIGLVMGVLLRRKLIVQEALPFPTGTATAELIKAVHVDHGSAARRTRFLIAAGVAAAVLTWFRDGRPSLVPQVFYLPVSILGLTAASLSLGVGTSPLMAATGMFIGVRSALSLVLGGLIGWATIAPIAVRAGWLHDGNYGSLASWLVWPALGMMTASTMIPVLLDWRKLGPTLMRALRDARNLVGGSAREETTDDHGVESPANSNHQRAQSRSANRLLGAAVVLIAAAALAWTGWRAFGFSPVLTCGALLLSVVLAAVCARAAGETDIAPVGSFGMLAQFLFSGGGAASSVLSGSIVSGNASQVAQAMWAFKAGHSLRASVRAQIIAQVMGAVVGSLVVVPIYLIVVRAYPLGSERMPAVSALSVKVTAEALTGGLAGLPPHGAHAAVIAFAVGALLCALARTRLARLLPSPMAMAIGLIMPVSLTAAALLGAVGFFVLRRRASTLGDGELNAIPAGLLAGESILGVVIAALTAFGVLKL